MFHCMILIVSALSMAYTILVSMFFVGALVVVLGMGGLVCSYPWLRFRGASFGVLLRVCGPVCVCEECTSCLYVVSSSLSSPPSMSTSSPSASDSDVTLSSVSVSFCPSSFVCLVEFLPKASLMSWSISSSVVCVSACRCE